MKCETKDHIFQLLFSLSQTSILFYYFWQGLSNISLCFFIAGNSEVFYEEDNEKNYSIVIMSNIFNRIHDLPDYGMMLLLIQEGISTFFLMFQICLLQFIMISLTLSKVAL